MAGGDLHLWQRLVFLAVAGAVGTLARYGLAAAIARWQQTPLGFADGCHAVICVNRKQPLVLAATQRTLRCFRPSSETRRMLACSRSPHDLRLSPYPR